MTATKYSSKDLSFKVGGSDGDELKAHILDDLTIAVEAVTEESTAMGDDWEKHLWTGIKRADSFTVGGFYDSAAGGPDALLNVVGTTIEIHITWGGSKTTTLHAIVSKFERGASRKAKTRYVATLLPTGEIQEDAT